MVYMRSESGNEEFIPLLARSAQLPMWEHRPSRRINMLGDCSEPVATESFLFEARRAGFNLWYDSRSVLRW